ncbi:hypothetical protein CYMTET_5644 [Cymbomonas tetramitiformis]|uniref:Uncharacterized protein n=1 Tax=Cymbomonas tetramitiformis TaxID=36881 RepID=A0AAE0GZ12_9CHLO|nr:hypothetical protein CYMTET_5644 [Cymbomonas tetramitiformis]
MGAGCSSDASARGPNKLPPLANHPESDSDSLSYSGNAVRTVRGLKHYDPLEEHYAEEGYDSDFATETTSGYNPEFRPERGAPVRSVAEGFLYQQKECREALFAPTAYETSASTISKPENVLKLEYVHGYRSNGSHNNLFYTSAGEAVYPAASLGVVHNLKTKKQRFFKGHTGEVISLAKHPTKDIIATGEVRAHSPTICVWNASTCQQLAVLKGVHTKSVLCLAFDPSGTFLASVGGNDDHTVAVYDWQKGVLEGKTAGDVRRVSICKYNPHTGQLVTAGERHLKFYELKNKKLQGTKALYGKVGKGQSTVTALTFLGDKSTLIATKGGDMYIFEGTKASKYFPHMHKGPIYGLDYVEQGKEVFILTAGADGKIHLRNPYLTKIMTTIDLSTARDSFRDGSHKLLAYTIGRAPCPTSISYSMESKTLLVGNSFNEVIQVDLSEDRTEPKYELVVQGHTSSRAPHERLRQGTVGALDCSTNKPTYFTGGEDNSIRCWSARTCEMTGLIQLTDAVQTISVHPLQGNILAAGCKTGRVFIVDVKQSVVVNSFTASHQGLTQCRFSPCGKMLAVAGMDTNIVVYSVNNKYKTINTFHGHIAPVTNLDWASDSSTLQTNSSSMELKFWSIDEGAEVKQKQRMADVDWATWTCPIGWAAQGTWPKGATGAEYFPTCSRSNRTHWQDGESVLAAGTASGDVQLFRYPSDVGCAEGVSVTGHSGAVVNCRFTFNEKYLVSTSSDGCIFQWRHYEPQEGEEESDTEETDVREQYDNKTSSQPSQVVRSGYVEGSPSYVSHGGGIPDPYKNHSLQELGMMRGVTSPLTGKQCLTQIGTPAGWAADARTYSSPEEGLELEWVYGFRGHDGFQNIAGAPGDKVVYHVGAMGVVLDPEAKAQVYVTDDPMGSGSLRGNTEDILSLAQHPNQKYHATGEVGPQPKIVVWDATAGAPHALRVLHGFHRRAVVSMAFSSSGQYLASLGMDDDHSVAIYDWDKEMLLATSKGDKNRLFHIAWSPHDGTLLTTGVKHVRSWGRLGQSSIKKGTRLSKKSLVLKPKGELQTFYTSCFPDADCAAVGTKRGDIYIFRAGKLASVLPVAHAGGATALYSTLDGTVYSGGRDGSVKTWDLKKAAPIRKVQVQTSGIRTVVPTVRSIYANSREDILVGTDAGEIVRVRGASKEPAVLVQGHGKGEVWGLALHPMKDVMVSSGDDGTLRVWNTTTNELVGAVMLTPKMKVPVGGDAGESGKNVKQLPRNAVRAVECSPGGDMVAAGMVSGEVHVLQLDTLAVAKTICDREAWISSLRWSPDGALLAVGSHSNVIDVYDARAGFKKVCSCKGHSSFISQMDFSKDGKVLRSNSGDHEVCFWYMPGSTGVVGKQLQNASDTFNMMWTSCTCTFAWPVLAIYSFDSDGADINSVHMSPSGHSIATGDDYGKVKLFRCPALGAPPTVYGGHSSRITGVRFNRSGKLLFSTGGDDTAVCKWRVTSVSSKRAVATNLEDVHSSVATKSRRFAEGADHPDLGPVAVGVLRLEYHYPPLEGDIDHEDSYGYKVLFRQVDGLTFEVAQSGKLPPAVKKSFISAIRWLEAKQVVGITGDCGFMMAYQVFVRQQTDVPVFMSSMVQAPMLIAAHDKEAKFAIFTANSKSLKPNLPQLLTECGVEVNVDRFVLVGLQECDGFDAVAKGERVNPRLVQPAILKRVRKLVEDEPELSGILLECTELPAYADAIRAETGLPVFDAITLVDFFHSACSDNPRFGTSYKKAVMAGKPKPKGGVKKALKKKFVPGADHPDLGPVAVGVLRLEYHYPPIAGDIDSADSYGYEVLFKQVDGLTFELAQSGKLTAVVKKNFISAIRWLESKDVVGITGDCGFMMAYQVFVRQQTDVPVFMSSMLQAPMLMAAFDKETKFAIFTANSKSLEPNIEWLLTECGIDVEVERFIVVGLQDVPGFDAVANGEKVDPRVVQPGILKVIHKLVNAIADLGAIILECTELPAYADAIRAESGLPVLDAITMVDYFHSSMADNPRFGKAYSTNQKANHDMAAAVGAKQKKFDVEFAEGADHPDLGPVAVGVLRLEYHYPPLEGDIDHEDSYGYKVLFRQVDGLTFEVAQSGKLPPAVKKSFISAIRWLEAKQVVGITGDCGFMMAYQVFVRQQTEIPVFMSSMVQAPMLIAAHDKEAKFAIFTANSKSLKPNLPQLLTECGVEVNVDRFVLVGLQECDGFDAVAKGERVNPRLVQPAILKRVRKLVEDEPELSGILLECTELPAYADAIRAETGLPVFDAITLVDFFHSACSDNPRFGTSYKKAVMAGKPKPKGGVKKALKKKFVPGADHPDLGPVAVGVLRLEYHYPPIAGDIDSADSYGYEVLFKQVDGLTFELAQSGKLTADVKKNFISAIRWLESKDVVGITGDCGFMMAYQVFVRQQTDVPVFMSSMLQAPMLMAAFDKETKFAIFTANSKSLEPNIEWLLTECGIEVEVERFIVVGLQDVPGFDAVANGEKVDPRVVQPGILKRVHKLVQDEPELGAIILECTELPAYADAIRAESGLPVLDAITMVDYFHSSMADNPRFGKAYSTNQKANHDMAAAVGAKQKKFDVEFAEGADHPDLGPVAVGVLRLEYHYPPLEGDIDHEDSYGYKVLFRQVDGLTFEVAQSGKLPPAVKKSFISAIRWLEAKQVVGITGDCGFMMAYQVFVRQQTEIPVFMSSMVQAPMLIAAHDKEAKFAIFTANSKSLKPNLPQLLTECGVEVNVDRFVLVGLQECDGFDAVAKGERVNPRLVQPAILKRVRKLVEDEPELSGILLECTELPAYADAIRAETGLPVFDAITLVDFFHSACSDNPRFGTSYKKAVMAGKPKPKGGVKKALKKKFVPGADHPDLGPVAVGVLRLEYHYPPIAGDIDSADSYGYEVLFKQVDGLTFELAQSGKLTADVKKNFISAIRWLESKDVVGITGDCGFMMAYQVFVRQQTDVPVFMSSMLQAPMLMAAFDKETKFAIFTANSKSLEPNIEWLLTECGIEVEVERFIVVGLQDVPGFDAVANGEKVDPRVVQPGILKRVHKLVQDEPELGAIILECTELPAYADAIRAESGLPVLDAITMVDYFHSSMADNPRFGKAYSTNQKANHDMAAAVGAKQKKFDVEFAEGADNPDLGPVAVGVLRLEYHYPPLEGDIDSADSYGYKVLFRQVDGLTFEVAQSGKMTKNVEVNMISAIRWLEAKQVVGITGDCGFMMAYQVFVRRNTELPVFMSSMMQAPMLIAAHDQDAKFAIFTANSKSLEPNLEFLLTDCGVEVDVDRFVLVGLQECDGFDAVAKGERVNPRLVQPAILKRVRKLVKDEPELAAIILECTELPAYADAIRAETGLPVFDAITLVDFFHSASSDNPHFGGAMKKGSFSGKKKGKGAVSKAMKKRFRPGADHPDLGPVGVGVLRLDYHYPPLAGDIDSADSYGYKVIFKQVDGLTFEMAQSGKMTKAVEKNLVSAIHWLESQEVAPMLIAAFDQDAKFGILTANSKSLEPNLDMLLQDCGVDVDVDRFVVLGLQNVPGFDAVAKGEAVDASVVQPGIVAAVQKMCTDEPDVAAIILECTELPAYADAIRAGTGIPVFDAITLECDGFDAVAKGERVNPRLVQPAILKRVRKLVKDEPELAAIILECTELPAYADAIRAETGLPVFDAITLVDFFHSASSDNPHFGGAMKKGSFSGKKKGKGAVSKAMKKRFRPGADHPDLGPVGTIPAACSWLCDCIPPVGFKARL